MSEKQTRKQFQTHPTGPTLVRQEFANKVGAKNIVKNIGRQVFVSSQNINSNHPVAEWDQETSAHQRLNIATQLDREFNSLSRELRQKFQTKENLLTYLSDKKNWKEAVDLGLLPKNILPPEQPQPAEPKIEGKMQKQQPEPKKEGQDAE